MRQARPVLRRRRDQAHHRRSETAGNGRRDQCVSSAEPLGEPLTLPVLLGAVGILAGVALAQFEDVRLLWRGRLATARGG